MARLVLVIDTTDSIAQLNSKCLKGSSKPHDSLQNCRNYIDAILAGAVDASVQSTTRDTDPSVGTSGSGSTQETYNLK